MPLTCAASWTVEVAVYRQIGGSFYTIYDKEGSNAGTVYSTNAFPGVEQESGA